MLKGIRQLRLSRRKRNRMLPAAISSFEQGFRPRSAFAVESFSQFFDDETGELAKHGVIEAPGAERV